VGRFWDMGTDHTRHFRFVVKIVGLSVENGWVNEDKFQIGTATKDCYIPPSEKPA
jgi:hypothetical protein